MRILIVDDHPLIREGLANLLKQLDPEVQVSDAISAEQARRVLESAAEWSLVLLDLTLPGADGMSLLAELRDTRPEVPVVVLSGNDSSVNVIAAIDLGAMGFISKRSSTSILAGALRLVLAGGVYIPPQALQSESEAVVRESRGGVSDAGTTSLRDLRLTDRQIEILALLVEGKPNKLICRELDIAPSTVKAHISAILRALRVENRTEAVVKLSRMGIKLPRLARSPRAGGVMPGTAPAK